MQEKDKNDFAPDLYNTRNFQSSDRKYLVDIKLVL